MAKHIAIIGAGLIGRILALECQLAGMSVSLFDRDNKDGQLSCAYAGAGMLAPYTELESAEPIIATLGIESLSLWPVLLKKLPRHVFFQQNGSLVLAHPQDHADLARFQRSVQFKLDSLPDQDSNRKDELYVGDRTDELHRQNHTDEFDHQDRRGGRESACHIDVIRAGGASPVPTISTSIVGPAGQNAILKACDRQHLSDLEPELPPTFTQGIYLSGEGQIDNRQLLVALEAALDQAGVDWQIGVEIVSLAPHKIQYIQLDHSLPERRVENVDSQNMGSSLYSSPDRADLRPPLRLRRAGVGLSGSVQSSPTITKEFDLVIDCRGLGSRPDINQLRGVRGELLVVEAPGVKLNRPIRLMHPRHSIYIVPRENNRFIIGATTIESEDMRPLTVQSALELLSAACTVHPEFAEGIILESRVDCRPALPDNLPAIILLSEQASHAEYNRSAVLPSRGETIGLIRVNGLYRHGFLISPKLAQLALAYIMGKPIATNYAQIFHTEIFSSEVSFTKELDTYNEVIALAASH